MSKKGVATAATFRAVTKGRTKAGFNLDTPSGIQDALTTLAVRCSKDPLRFVQLAFPWGKGTLEKYTGPDTWQTEILTAMRDRLQSGHEREEVYQDATAAGHGCGKALDIKQEVDTPDGLRVWGDLKVGDRLWGPDGKPTTIVAIPYRGVRPCYRVTFDDGASTIASQEHLWTVYDYQGLPYTLETRQIAQLGCKKPVRFGAATFYYPMWKLPEAINPYTKKSINRSIDSVEPIGERDTMCVTVDREDGLFLANDFIVTHNSGLVAWLVLWALCTYPDTRGVVTANTETQLRTKTFAEVAKWYNVCLFKDWFTCSAMSIYSKQPGHDKTWRIDAIPWSETNPEAFAGLHNAGARTLVIFDEASAISNVIWEVTEGALTDKDTEKFWLCFGNPTRNTGRFFDCFNRFRHRWVHRHIDTRNAVMSDKVQIQKWIDDYGEDSDFVKVRVRGVFPSSSNMQFISRDVVDTAAQRESEPQSIITTVCILGVDVARFGDDRSVIFCRVGMDARSWKHREYRGLDGWQLGAKVAEFYNDLVSAGARRVVINIDAGGVGSSPLDWLRKNGYEVNGINFGESPSRKDLYANKRAEIWARGREWLKAGGQIENSDDLITDLTGVEFDYTPKNLLLLEKKEDMKKRGLSSPDLADALMLTLAIPMNEYLADIQPVTPYRNNRRAETRDPYA